jgi:hypothetical protein
MAFLAADVSTLPPFFRDTVASSGSVADLAATLAWDRACRFGKTPAFAYAHYV